MAKFVVEMQDLNCARWFIQVECLTAEEAPLAAHTHINQWSSEASKLLDNATKDKWTVTQIWVPLV